MSVIAMQGRLYRADRDGRRLDDLSTAITSGKVSHSADTAIPLWFTAEFRTIVGLEAFVDFLAPELTLRYGDGRVVTAQAGLFAVIPATKRHASRRTRGSLRCDDLTALLLEDVFEDGYSVAAGTEYVAAAIAILTGSGFTRYAIPASGKTLPMALSWPPGVSRLEVINDLLQGVAYYRLWCDGEGVLTSRPYLALDQAEPSATYSSANGAEIVGEIDDEPDLTRLANVVVVRRITPNQAPLYAKRINSNPASPTSTTRIGRRPRTIESSELVDQAAADALADAYLSEGSSFYRRLTLKTVPDPTAGAHDVLTLDIANDDGSVATDAWWRLSWDLGFTPRDGAMTHRLARVESFGGAP